MANLVVVNTARWNVGAALSSATLGVEQWSRPCDIPSSSDWVVPSSEVAYTLEREGRTRVSQW